VRRIVGNHTAVVLKENVVLLLEEWKIMDKFRFITTDNAANIVKAVGQIADHVKATVGSNVVHFRCIGHVLNLTVKKVIVLRKCDKCYGIGHLLNLNVKQVINWREKFDDDSQDNTNNELEYDYIELEEEETLSEVQSVINKIASTAAEKSVLKELNRLISIT
jgi:hypothetical protein